MKFIFSKKCLEYCLPGHPESPERVKSIYTLLKSKGVEFIEPDLCCEEDILKVHTEELLCKVKSGNFFDRDTPSLPGMYEYARLSAGAAIVASELEGCSIMRPPGHHAGRNFLSGFCYFNNISIAIAKFGKRAAILDIDCHHGNGTEDIFLGNTKVLYISLHRYGFFYPGTGCESRENIINYPLSYGISEDEYLETIKHAIKEVKSFGPEILGISVGFDTYKLDPIAGLGLGVNSYKKIGTLFRNTGIPTFYVLEGGYSSELAQCLYQMLY